MTSISTCAPVGRAPLTEFLLAWGLLALVVTGETTAQDAKPPAEKLRFVDRGAYVEDKETGLLWQKDGATAGKRNFQQAADYAKGLKLGGLSGWRVPTIAELKTIFPAEDAPFVNTGYTPDMCCGGGKEFRSYWTSELDTRLDDYAFVFQWYNKGGANNCSASGNFVNVRCVRDAKRPEAAVKVDRLDEAIARRARELIKQLGDEDFNRREKAYAAIIAYGAKIVPLLRTTLDPTDDPEVRFRITSLLEQLDPP